MRRREGSLMGREQAASQPHRPRGVNFDKSWCAVCRKRAAACRSRSHRAPPRAAAAGGMHPPRRARGAGSRVVPRRQSAAQGEALAASPSGPRRRRHASALAACMCADVCIGERTPGVGVAAPGLGHGPLLGQASLLQLRLHLKLRGRRRGRGGKGDGRRRAAAAAKR